MGRFYKYCNIHRTTETRELMFVQRYPNLSLKETNKPTNQIPTTQSNTLLKSRLGLMIRTSNLPALEDCGTKGNLNSHLTHL